MGRIRSAVLAGAALLLGCADEAPRPVLDLEPYERACGVATPCPDPYVCVDDSTDHDDVTTCLVPCASDSECPVGFFCNGVNYSADRGALYHCAEDV